MSRINRRTMLQTGVAAIVGVSPALANENPTKLPVIIIDAENHIANRKELFAGIPWRPVSTQGYGYTGCPIITDDLRVGVPTRSRHVWLPKAHAFISGWDFIWGEVELKEELRVWQVAIIRKEYDRNSNIFHPSTFSVNPEPMDPEGYSEITGTLAALDVSCREQICDKACSTFYRRSMKVKDAI